MVIKYTKRKLYFLMDGGKYKNMARPRTSVNTTIENTVDGQTGEFLSQIIKQEVTSQSIPEGEPDFIKLYLNRLAKIQGLNNSQANILFEIAKLMPWASDDEQFIILNAFTKERIAKKLGVQMQYIKDSVSKLTKEGMLIKAGSARSAAYTVNPLYIAKGRWEDIKKLQLRITFDQQHGEVIDSVDIEKIDGTTETIQAFKQEVAATKTKASLKENENLEEIERATGQINLMVQ
jgi:hypothetical protein